MKPAQAKKFEKMKDDIEELLTSGANGMLLLRQTIDEVAPAFIQMKMHGKVPSVEMLQIVAVRLTAIVLASQKE